MLSKNIRAYRQAKGLSQEELAAKINVVRQTVSKWEKGLSVPDAEMLIVLAEVFEVPVAALLGEEHPTEEALALQSLADKLEALNGQFARREEKARTTKRRIFGVLICVAVILFLCEIVPLVYCLLDAGATLSSGESIGIIGGADGPTAIFVTSTLVNLPAILVTALILVAAAIGFYKTK